MNDRRRWLLGGAGLLAVLLGVALVVGPKLWKTHPQPEADRFALTPIASSPFLNTRPDARYVGSAACRSCHESRHLSFRRTGMGRSMAEVDAPGEPPDGVFDHALSKRRYQVCRKDGRLWHRELLLAGGAQEVVLSEHPVKYVVGSGRHSRTYLVEVDGFLVESPVTWYTSRQAWGMSPGYDAPDQLGFERAAGEGCLVCHAGHAEAVGQSLHRMRIVEAAIGCERCHGPGSLHVARHEGTQEFTGASHGAVDLTIVNPVHLPRQLAEAVCQQCHLRPSAVVVARGRNPSDFRPGLPLQDFLQPYVFEEAETSMTVVGHVEQMHLSRCYQRSDRLSCLTCHNPHDEPRPAERVAYYKSICLNCHRPEHCGVAERRRERESPDNNCVHCHMPRSPTEIPHLAFTHHRIGVHGRSPGTGGTAGQARRNSAELRPFLDLSRLSDIDRRRSLGLGYLEAANREKDAARMAHCQEQALGLLSGARAAGLQDPVLDVSLARLRFDIGLGEVLPYAESALTHSDLIGQERCNALFLLADAHASRGRHEDAVAVLRQLTGLRRHSVDWLLLADCQRALGNQAALEEALTTAARINPRLWKVHQHLAEHYRRKGDAERAAWHQQRALP